MWHTGRTLLDPAAGGARDELFLVEGESAYHAVRAVRDRARQTVFAMQGKPLNVTKHSRASVRAHPMLAALTRELMGSETSAPAPALTRPQLLDATPRYQHVILLFDPDADGIHCGALVLLFLWQFARTLVTEHRVTVITPPVGEVRLGAELHYPIDVPAFFALCKRAKEAHTDGTTLRYRGVGGIRPEILRTWCVDPATRKGHLADAALAQHAMSLFGGYSGQGELPL